MCGCFFVCIVCVVSLYLMCARLSFALLCDCVLVPCCLIIVRFIRADLLFVFVFSLCMFVCLFVVYCCVLLLCLCVVRSCL